MKLTRIELCCLRVADGIATPKDFERLRKAGIDADSWQKLSSRLQGYLISGSSVDFSSEVMQAIETSLMELPNIKELLADPENPPSVIDGVMGQIFEETVDFSVPLELLKDPEPPSLTNMIMGSILENAIEDSEEFASEDLLEAVFSNMLEDDQGRELLQDDDSMEFFPELSQVIQEEQSDSDVSFDAALQEELAEVLREALSEETRIFDETEIVSKDRSLIDLAEEKPFVPVLERIEVSELELHFEDDSDEEILTMTSPYVITEAVLEEQAIRFSLQLSSILNDETELELDIWSSISSKIIAPPLRLVRDSARDSMDSFEENSISADLFEDNPFETENQAVEFISTKTIDVDSTISKVSLWTLGGLIAAAAVWLLLVLPGQSVESTSDERLIEAFEVAQVNSLEVEELEVAKDMEVQIFQASEDAPTIIFIDSYAEGGG